MSIFSIVRDPMGMVFFSLPLFSFIVALIMQLAIKRRGIVLSLVFIGYLLATFTIFNSSFLIWCFIYTGIAVGGTVVADLILKNNS
jgi:hypothetical protein